MPTGVYKRTKFHKKILARNSAFKKGNTLGFKKDKPAWNKGKRYLQISGVKNVNWKGDKVGNIGLHNWVKRWLGKPNKCQYCNKIKTTPKSIQWANKSRKYKRELTDWIRLCASCHKLYDTNKITIKEMKIKLESLFLKANINVNDKDIIILLDEGKYVPGKFGKALNFQVKLSNGEVKTYSMNSTSQKNLTNEWGDDTANWINKPLKVWVVRQVVKGKMTNVLYLTPENWTEPVRDAEVIDDQDIPVVEDDNYKDPNEINVKDIPF